MEKYSGPEDLYDELVENSNEDWLLGLVAFAIVEEQRIEWMKHQAKHNGEVPGHEEICSWYKQQPKGVLLRAKDTAESRLKDYSGQIIELLQEDLKKEIEESIIVNEIRESKKFWPQFGVNLAGGFVSALLFASLLTMVAFLVINDSSPIQIGTALQSYLEIDKNGEK